MKLLVIIALLKVASCGYLPPPDNYGDNRTPTCACDETQISTLAEKISQLELNLDKQRSRSDALEKRVAFHERSEFIHFVLYYLFYRENNFELSL